METDSANPRAVMGCRRVGRGLLVYVPQKMFGRGVGRSWNVDFWRTMLTSVAQAGVMPGAGSVADQSADDAPVQVREGSALVCAPESLRTEAQVWARKISAVEQSDVRVLLCDSMCQAQELCGKRTFRHFGAFRKDYPTKDSSK